MGGSVISRTRNNVTSVSSGGYTYIRSTVQYSQCSDEVCGAWEVYATKFIKNQHL